MNETNQSQIDTIISAISLINTSLSIPVFLPISNKNIQIKQLTTAQEKRLVKNITVNDQNTVIPSIFPILQDCVETKDIDLMSLPIPDVYAILIKLRIFSIGQKLSLLVPSKNKGKKQDRITININLNDIYNQFIEKFKKFKKEEITIQDDPYIFVLSLPTMKDFMNTSERSDDTTFMDTISEELYRMIKTISIVSGEEKQTINMSNFTIEEKNKILDNIPNRSLIKIINESNDFIKTITDLLLFDVEVDGEHYSHRLNVISPDFFTRF